MTPKAQALCRSINQYQASCASRRIYAWREAGREMSSIRMCGDKVEMECLSIECLFWMGTARRDRRSQYCSVHMQVWSVNSWSLSGCCVQARNRRVKEKAKASPREKSKWAAVNIRSWMPEDVRPRPYYQCSSSSVCLHEIITGHLVW